MRDRDPKLMTERNAETPEGKRILYRIGINLGDALVEGDDIIPHSDNIAARLQGGGDPGGIYVSGSAYDHVRGRVDAPLADLGEKALACNVTLNCENPSHWNRDS